VITRRLMLMGICGLGLMLLLSGSAYATTWTGSLSSAEGGIQGTGDWIDNVNDVPMTLDWSVAEVLSGTGQVMYWHYDYTIAVWSGNGSISHFIIEATDTFEDLPSSWFNVTGPDSWMQGENNTEVGPVEIQPHTSGSGNPEMPGNLDWGIKFDETSEDADLFVGTFSFDSYHQPVWGDFYTRDGVSFNATAWNAGFISDDPLAPPQDGHLEYHLLVPDSKIPEPVSVIFFATGLVGVFGFVKRRKMQLRK